MGLRGSVEFTVMSRGPGTNTKCVNLEMWGYEVMRSASASKLSVKAYLLERLAVEKSKPALVPLNISCVTMCDGLACEVATHDNDPRDKIILDAIIEHLLDPRQRLRVVQPDIRQEEEIQFREFFAYANLKLCLCNKGMEKKTRGQ